MKHEYTVVYHNCPICGKTLKTDNPMLYLALSILTAFLPWLWFWGASILEKIFNFNLKKMGSPIKACPKCGTLVNMRKKFEWCELSLLQKKSWAFRRHIRCCIALSGIVLFCWVLALLPILGGEFEPSILILIFSPSILIIYIYHIYNKWTDNLKKEEIIVSFSDYILIRESWSRLHKKEPTAEEINVIKIKETGEIINL